MITARICHVCHASIFEWLAGTACPARACCRMSNLRFVEQSHPWPEKQKNGREVTIVTNECNRYYVMAIPPAGRFQLSDLRWTVAALRWTSNRPQVLCEQKTVLIQPDRDPHPLASSLCSQSFCQTLPVHHCIPSNCPLASVTNVPVAGGVGQRPPLHPLA